MPQVRKLAFRSGTDLDIRLADIERRLDRLERLAFMGYTDIRKVADYAYDNVRLEVSADEVKKLSEFQQLSDNEALKVGLMVQEIALLKMTARGLRKQTRLDAVGIVRDMMRRKRAATGLEEVSRERKRSPQGSRARDHSVSPVPRSQARTEDLA